MASTSNRRQLLVFYWFKLVKKIMENKKKCQINCIKFKLQNSRFRSHFPPPRPPRIVNEWIKLCLSKYNQVNCHINMNYKNRQRIQGSDARKRCCKGVWMRRSKHKSSPPCFFLFSLKIKKKKQKFLFRIKYLLKGIYGR